MDDRINPASMLAVATVLQQVGPLVPKTMTPLQLGILFGAILQGIGGMNGWDLEPEGPTFCEALEGIALSTVDEVMSVKVCSTEADLRAAQAYAEDAGMTIMHVDYTAVPRKQ